MTDQRHFQRIKFVTRTEIELNGHHLEATLVDISMKGALFTLGAPPYPEIGQTCRLSIHLNLAELVLPFESTVVHSHENVVGVKFTKITIDAMIHLRRLLELNSADPDLVRSELNNFIGGD